MLKFVDRDILVAFHGREYAVDGYASPAVAPFLPRFLFHVYAGVPRALREWWRVLKPGGVAVITTPNRERLVALAEELRASTAPIISTSCPTAPSPGLCCPNADSSSSSRTGYMEFRLRNLFNCQRVTDFLQREGNRAEHIPTMREMSPLGRYAP